MDTGFYYTWRNQRKDKTKQTIDCSDLVVTIEHLYSRIIRLEERLYKLEHPDEFREGE
jgi:hypothetical protein